jgi:hypothetical protein
VGTLVLMLSANITRLALGIENAHLCRAESRGSLLAGGSRSWRIPAECQEWEPPQAAASAASNMVPPRTLHGASLALGLSVIPRVTKSLMNYNKPQAFLHVQFGLAARLVIAFPTFD